MKWRDVVVVGGTALATALVALPILCVGYAIANEGPRPEIQWPVLRASGCEITLRTERTNYREGETPIMELVAANPSGSPVTLEATVRMTAQSPSDMMSRVVRAPRQSWEQRIGIELGAGERRVMPVPTGTPVTAGSSVTFQLRVGTATVNTPPITIPGNTLLLRQVVQQKVAAPSQAPQVAR
jgi:hypothetical protein